jgi:MbtH protein
MAADEQVQGLLVVVVNDEEQYSLWPEGRELPGGWRAAGMSGSREACLEYIRKVWTDMRPRSVREAQAKQERE